jgi:hypothetical protein
LEEEKRELDTTYKSELDSTEDYWKGELESIQLQCSKYKAELEQLSDFKSRKVNYIVRNTLTQKTQTFILIVGGT